MKTHTCLKVYTPKICPYFCPNQRRVLSLFRLDKIFLVPFLPQLRITFGKFWKRSNDYEVYQNLKYNPVLNCLKSTKMAFNKV